MVHEGYGIGDVSRILRPKACGLRRLATRRDRRPCALRHLTRAWAGEFGHTGHRRASVAGGDAGAMRIRPSRVRAERMG